MSRLSARGAESLNNMDHVLSQLKNRAGGSASVSRVAQPSTGSSSPAPPVDAPLSSAAATLLQQIDAFDLFAARPAAPARVNTAGPQSSSSASCAIGGDDPIPNDAPAMSDAVMAGANEDTHGSRVIYIGRGGSAKGQGFKYGAPFVRSLRRATQSLYFEELQYQIPTE